VTQGLTKLAMLRILPPEARRRHWHGRYSAGAAADLATWRGAQRCAPSSVNAAEARRLPAIACMLAREALIAALVVASEAGHQLLSLCGGWIRRLGQEVLGVVPSEGCSDAPAMQDLDVSVLAASVSEAEVRWLGGGFGGHGVQRGVPVLPNVRAEPTREAGRPWPAADNEPATRLPAKGGLPRGVGARARG